MSEHPFRTFILLIQLDHRIDKIDQEIATTTTAVHQEEQKHKAAAQESESLQQKLRDAKKRVHEIEKSLSELDAKEKDKKKRLETSGSQREFESTRAEIERIQHTRLQQEDDLLAQWNVADGVQRTVTLQETQSKEVALQLSVATQEQEKKKAALQIEKEALQEKRKEYTPLIPAEWLERYDMMRTRIADPVVPMVSESCGGCFQHLPPQVRARLAHKALVQCNACFRLIYSAEAMDASPNLSLTSQEIS